MTASAEIASASVKDALLVPNGALRFTPTTTPSRGSGRGLVGSLMPGPPHDTSSQPAASKKDSAQQVWVLRDGVPVAVPVTVGQTNGRYTQITSGDLRDGMEVITDMSEAQS
jgi:HlyD family secretion protein